jgi:beta-galactosidase
MKKILPILVLLICAAASAEAQRQVTDLTGGDWKFILQDAAPDADTATWGNVSVPHTWNAFDGQDGPTPGAKPRPSERGGADYYRGVGWYERSLDIPAAWQGKRVFLRFEAVSEVATVYLNGQQIGDHRGSFTAFCLELTPFLKYGQANELRVRVDNSVTRAIAPLAGDFNLDGGIYRPLCLITTDPVCVTPLDYASPGVFLTTEALDDKQAQVEIRTEISNGLPAAVSAQVITEIKDASGQIVASNSTALALPAGNTTQEVVQNVTIASPHAWNGRKDPYLYSASVRVVRDGQMADEVVQPLGLRTVQITDAQGFLLNGQPYPIHGVDRHQDLKDHGWALSPADHDRDMQMLMDMGVTAIRLAHYPQSEYFHDLCDHTGILLWNEVPFVNEVPNAKDDPKNPSAATQAFQANLDQQMHEMILQRYNHPSVAFWGLFNELNTGANDRVALPIVQHLNALAHELDHTRITVAASNHLNNSTNFVPDRIAYNVYPGWYSTFDKGDIGQLIDQRFAEQHDRRIALSEYGAGANPEQHEEGPLTAPKANNSPFHPEDWQAYVHERDWAEIKGNPKLWGTFLWVMFDFASDGRREGGHPGINDKGMVTQDRQIKKDVYYFYQANWTDTPMVYITSRRAVQRQLAQTDIKVYSNCAEVELQLNGNSLGKVAPDDIKIARWGNVTLQPGQNEVVAIGTAADGKVVRDNCEWTLTPPAAKP